MAINQQFGSIQTAQGSAKTMLSIDSDRPSEFMIHWYGEGITPGAVLAHANTHDSQLLLVPRLLYRIGDKGGLILPPTLSADEIKWRDSSKATLVKDAAGYRGEWIGLDGVSRAVTFNPPGDTHMSVEAEICESWEAFKKWATRARFDQQAAWFRGHGCNKFSLRTKLHRAGRNRLERYCHSELTKFAQHAEAVMQMRFDLGDANEYSTLLALAQHHGLPTPLLDWTASPYVAAFFAFTDALESRDSRANSTHVRIFVLSKKFVETNAPTTIMVTGVGPYLACLSVTPLHNPRLYAQQGRFLVTNLAEVESWLRFVAEHSGEKVISAVDIPLVSTVEALEDLAFMGLTAATMFPGLDGVGRMIAHEIAFGRPSASADLEA